MQHYQDVLQDRSGNAIAGAIVTVLYNSTSLPADLYSDYAGTHALTSIVTDADGSYSFYVSSGRYDYAFYKNGKLLKTQNDVFIDQSTALQDLSTSAGASLVGFNPAGTISSTTVQTAIEEINTDLAATTGAGLVGFKQAGTGTITSTVDAKLKEKICVLDFGADPTGVADSTAAFTLAAQAAIANDPQKGTKYALIPMCDWAVVSIPFGTFVISSQINTNNKEIVWDADVGAMISNPDYLNGHLLRTGSKVTSFHNGIADAGTTFSVMANRRIDETAGVSGYVNPNELSKTNGLDSVGAYFSNRVPAAIYTAASVTSYSATGVVLSTPMTASQLSKMRKGMMIRTKHTSPNPYGAFVESWTANTITVETGWFLYTGVAGGTPATPSGTDGVDINVFRKAWAINANVFLDTASYGNAANGFELGMVNTRGEPVSRGGNVEATGFYSVNIGANYGDTSYLVGGNWTYGYKTYGSVQYAFSYIGNIGSSGDPLVSLLLGQDSSGVFFYNVKADGSVEAGPRGSASNVFHDFHSGATDCDYDSRITASGGDGTAGNGTLTVTAKRINLTAPDSVLSGRTHIGVKNAVDDTNLYLYNTLSGSVNASSFRNIGFAASTVTTLACGSETAIGTNAANFTLANLRQVQATQGALGQNSTVTTQIGFYAGSGLVGATNNYAFEGRLAALNNTLAATTISNVSVTGNVVTITTTTAHGLLSNYRATIAATTNTQLNGSGYLVTFIDATNFSYPLTTGNVTSVADTGTVTPAKHYNLYISGTAPNYMAGKLSIGATDPGTGTILDVQSTTAGVRFPNMTTTQKTAITPAAGTMVFDTTLAKLCVYTGAAWQTITSV